jgi:hypothetical protein
VQQPAVLMCLSKGDFFRGAVDSTVANINRGIVHDFTPLLRHLACRRSKLGLPSLQFRPELLDLLLAQFEMVSLKVHGVGYRNSPAIQSLQGSST